MNVDVEKLRNYYSLNAVFITRHAAERCRQRGIVAGDIRCAVMSGEIIEDYPDDYPHPSCLIYGVIRDSKVLHAVVGSDDDTAYIITAYFPNTDKFEENLKTRRK